jgi:predicted P-loop ATPase/GTPase
VPGPRSRHTARWRFRVEQDLLRRDEHAQVVDGWAAALRRQRRVVSVDGVEADPVFGLIAGEVVVAVPAPLLHQFVADAWRRAVSACAPEGLYPDDDGPRLRLLGEERR